MSEKKKKACVNGLIKETELNKQPVCFKDPKKVSFASECLNYPLEEKRPSLSQQT